MARLRNRLPLGALRGFGWFRRARLSVVPSVAVGAALVLAGLTLLLDRYVITELPSFVPIFSGSPDTARTILSLIATSIATLTALLFTIVAVVVQLASQQFSPRALRTLLQDVASHIAFGLLLGAFTYVVVVLQALGLTIEDDRSVSLSITVAFVLAIFDLVIFVLFADHLLHEARVTSIIDRVADRTRESMDRSFPATLDQECPFAQAELPEEDRATITLQAPKAGVLMELDLKSLVRRAAEHGLFLRIVPAIGDFVPTGASVIEVFGTTDRDHLPHLLSLVTLDPERSITQDVAFGFRLLVDIAERSLSPSVNDPTTAVACIDRLHDFLRFLANRHLHTGFHTDDEDQPRLYVPPMRWEDFVLLSTAEIRHYGKGSLQVARRLRAMLEDLWRAAPEERRAVLEDELRLLEAMVERSFPDELDQRRGRVADWQGIGSANAGRSD